VIIFRKLTKEEAGKICYKIIDGLRAKLAARSVSLEITDKAMDKLIEEGYNDMYGARPLKRVVQKRIEDRLSDEILAGNILHGEVVTVDVVNGEFSFRSEKKG
jgi:ATP-dependent Clp protease ATP-binding subunit ClpA